MTLPAALTLLGEPSVVAAVSAAAAAAWAWRRRRRELAALVLTMAGAGLLNEVLKAAFRRPRPEGSGLESWSFPSGHALLAAALYAALAAAAPPRRRAAAAASAVAVTAAVAWSRVALGVHHVEDVAAGALLGFAWAAASRRLVLGWK